MKLPVFLDKVYFDTKHNDIWFITKSYCDIKLTDSVFYFNNGKIKVIGGGAFYRTEHDIELGDL